MQMETGNIYQPSALYSEAQIVITIGFSEPTIDPHTTLVPCCLLPLNNRPLLYHIMHYYYQYGFNNFILLCNETVVNAVSKCLENISKASETAPESWQFDKIKYRIYKSQNVFVPSELLVRMVEEDYIQADNIYLVPSHTLCTFPPSILLDAQRSTDSTITVLISNDTYPNGISSLTNTKEAIDLATKSQEYLNALGEYGSKLVPDYVSATKNIPVNIRGETKFNFSSCKDGILLVAGSKTESSDKLFSNPTPEEIIFSQTGKEIVPTGKDAKKQKVNNLPDIEIAKLMHITNLNSEIIKSDTDSLEMPLYLLQQSPTANISVYDSKPFALVIAREFIPVLHQVENIIDIYTDLPAFVAEQENLCFELKHPAVRKYLDMSSDVFAVNESYHMEPTSLIISKQNDQNQGLRTSIQYEEEDDPIEPTVSLDNTKNKLLQLEDCNKPITESTILDCLVKYNNYDTYYNNIETPIEHHVESTGLITVNSNQNKKSSNSTSLKIQGHYFTSASQNINSINEISENNNKDKNCEIKLDLQEERNSNFLKPYTAELKRKSEYQKMNVGAGHGINTQTMQYVTEIVNRHLENDFVQYGGNTTTLADFIKPKRSIIASCVMFNRETQQSNVKSSGSLYTITNCPLIYIKSPASLTYASRVLKEFSDLPSIPSNNDINNFIEYSQELSESFKLREKRIIASDDYNKQIKKEIEEKVTEKYNEAILRIEQMKAAHAPNGKPPKSEKKGKKGDSEAEKKKELNNLITSILNISGPKHNKFVFLDEDPDEKKNIQGYIDMKSHVSIKSEISKNVVVIDSVIDDFCKIRSNTDEEVEKYINSYKSEESNIDQKKKNKKLLVSPQEIGIKDPGVVDYFNCMNNKNESVSIPLYNPKMTVIVRSFIGKNVTIEPGVHIYDSIIMDHAIIKANSKIKDCCINTPQSIIENNVNLTRCQVRSNTIVKENTNKEDLTY